MKRIIFFALFTLSSVILLHSQTGWLNNGTNLYYNNGNVGIGTSSPASILDIKGAENPAINFRGTYTRLEIGIPSSNGRYFSQAKPGDVVIRPLGAYNNHMGLIFTLPTLSNNGSSYIKFGDDYNGGWFTIFNNKKVGILGSIGIGTDAPLYNLHVTGTGYVNTLTTGTMTTNLLGVGGTTAPQASLDVLDKTVNKTKSILARLSEGTNTYLSVKSYNTQPDYCKSFAIEHVHANTVNGAINFFRGGSQVGGTIAFSIDGAEKGRFSSNGLDVNGIIHAKEVKIDLTGWADYVFAEEYNLSPLSTVKKHIEENKRLPDIPSEAEVKEEGVNMGEMQVLMLRKIEELTLYTIQQQELIDVLTEKVEELENKTK